MEVIFFVFSSVVCFFYFIFRFCFLFSFFLLLLKRGGRTPYTPHIFGGALRFVSVVRCSTFVARCLGEGDGVFLALRFVIVVRCSMCG